ncbi:GGDEF domain-containing protein [Butyrivibrio sp. DSM 10294]|uniref:bifunctional diguanylate cyclase/phosphodiesterase n=1 Tax=Butyrivibrio sp. DSM 10294 TaxID=2972457 RepID=UPI00234EED36|nr:GGDEF domain-containing protein [Butyrivibrio sp. DSM 10294]MDC7294373.1 GGDEF domain-containing protein [Butyrivibrio sp. DSM 10294]
MKTQAKEKVTDQYFIDNLDRAIKEEWIKAYHQPLIRSASGLVSDEEAFARWEDPEKGTFSPADFLPVLEREKLTYKLDLYMVERVLNKMKGQGEHGLFIVPESINLAASDFECCDMVEEIVKRVDASGLSRDKLSVELSERTVSRDIGFMKTQVERFQSQGIKVWMDDYGSGYSSLLILLEIKFNLLKIDKIFVDKILDGVDGQIILTELVKTALSLGIDTVAEGVEVKEQADFLKEIGCTKLQGFYYTTPVSLAQIIKRNEEGIQIGFENPAEGEYYEQLGKISLYDLSFSKSESDGLKDYFDTLPMIIISMDDERIKIIRSNKSFKEFEAAALPGLRECSSFEISSIKPGPGYYTFTQIRQCAKNGNRLIIDDRLSDGRSLQLFMRRIAQNPVTGCSAIAIAILSISDKISEDNLTYNYIARTLSSDYISLYFVDLDTEEFSQYISDGTRRDITLKSKGTNFFDLTRPDFNITMQEEDKSQFIKDFTKEKIMNALDNNGIFSLVTRIFIGDSLTYVSLKVVRVGSDEKHIIMGVSDVDELIKNREIISLAKEEQLVYSRIGALSGDYIYIYTVDPETGHYTRFTPAGIITDMGMEDEGDDFFSEVIKNSSKGIYHEDHDSFLSAFTKENIIKTIATRGVFEHSHRLNIQGRPNYVIARAVWVSEDDHEKLIFGVIDVDERVRREQEYEKHLFAVENKAILDELTGVKNKHAYADTEETLNAQISANKVSPFAIAVFDINGLKQVNDTLGHQAGDEFIKSGCNIICDFFKHSPVFRVGGDEFVVVAQGNDYNNIDSIMKRFEANNLKNKKRGTVVIAAGVSRFNADTTVSEVFSRADIEMYENKRKLKEA